MKFGTDYLMRQIKIPTETYHKIKQFCFHKKISLTIFYENMLDWFLTQFNTQDSLQYLASTKHAHILSLWVSHKQVAKISAMAAQAKVSDARVIYTAMMLYLESLPEFIES